MYILVCPHCKSEDVEVIENENNSNSVLRCNDCMNQDEGIFFDDFNTGEWLKQK